ncbi:MAG TPA: DUF3570 domain-containing protein [Kofleriaceae bacterium]
MRLQLALAGLVASAGVAAADGSVSVRGVYYKERATRVIQPMLDGIFEAGARGLVTTHLLVDSITSASTSAGAVDATGFNEKRYEGGLGYNHLLGPLKLAAEGKYSSEPDYGSLYLGARAELELAEKNTVLGVGGGVAMDTIGTTTEGGLGALTLECAPGEAPRSECDLTTISLFASASQIVSRRAVVGLSYDLSTQDGFTSNPYRLAIAANMLVRERHPTERRRHAVAASARYHIAETDTTLVAVYRYYRDTWKIRGHTPELRAVQAIGDTVDASFRYRYHTQNAAFFYEERYMEEDPDYRSDDVKLSKFRTHTLESKLGILGETFGLDGRWGAARFEGILSYVIQQNRFGNAIIAHFAITVPFEY